MKIVKCRILVLAVMLLAVCWEAWADVEINETNFPDDYFRAHISRNFDHDNDGTLTNAEISSVRSISYIDGRANSLKGIEYFKYLTTLDCRYSINLTALDISKNTLLQTLDCYGCKLTSLNFGSNSALKVLNCSENRLTTIDISKIPALTTLDCSKNRITALDTSVNAAMTTLKCAHNYLSSIDTSNNIALRSADFGYNHINTLNLSRNIMLNSLSVNNNYLMELDVSNNKYLTSLNCNNNFLTELDLTGNTALSVFSCSGNKISELDLSKNRNMNKVGYLDLNQNIRGAKLTDNGDGTFTFDLKTLVSSANLSKVAFSDGVAYNPSTGIITFQSSPNSVSYTYDTGYMYTSNFNKMTFLTHMLILRLQ